MLTAPLAIHGVVFEPTVTLPMAASSQSPSSVMAWSQIQRSACSEPQLCPTIPRHPSSGIGGPRCPCARRTPRTAPDCRASSSGASTRYMSEFGRWKSGGLVRLEGELPPGLPGPAVRPAVAHPGRLAHLIQSRSPATGSGTVVLAATGPPAPTSKKVNHTDPFARLPRAACARCSESTRPSAPPDGRPSGSSSRSDPADSRTSGNRALVALAPAKVSADYPCQLLEPPAMADGPVMVITGASSGIGAATARRAAGVRAPGGARRALRGQARRRSPRSSATTARWPRRCDVTELGGPAGARGRGPGPLRADRRLLRQRRLRGQARLPRGDARVLEVDDRHQRARRGAVHPGRAAPLPRARQRATSCSPAPWPAGGRCPGRSTRPPSGPCAPWASRCARRWPRPTSRSP